MIDLDGQAKSSYSFSTSRTKVYQAVWKGWNSGIVRYFQHRQKKKSVFSWHKKQHKKRYAQFWATISRKQEPHWNMEYYKAYIKHCQQRNHFLEGTTKAIVFHQEVISSSTYQVSSVSLCKWTNLIACHVLCKQTYETTIKKIPECKSRSQINKPIFFAFFF